MTIAGACVFSHIKETPKLSPILASRVEKIPSAMLNHVLTPVITPSAGVFIYQDLSNSKLMAYRSTTEENTILFPLNTPTQIIKLPQERFVVGSQNNVTIYCGRTLTQLNSIALLLPKHTKRPIHNHGLTLIQLKTSHDGSILLAHLEETFSVEEKVHGEVHHRRNFIFLIRLINNEVLRIPFAHNTILDVNFINPSQLVIVLENNVKIYGFSFTLKASSCITTVPLPRVTKIWTYAQHPHLAVIARENHDSFSLELYEIQENEPGEHSFRHQQKIADIQNIDYCITHYNSFIFFLGPPPHTATLMEFNLTQSSAPHSLKISESKFTPTGRLCLFPDDQIGVVGCNDENQPYMARIQLRSANRYIYDRMAPALESALPKNFPRPLCEMIGGYNINSLDWSFFSPTRTPTAKSEPRDWKPSCVLLKSS